MRTSPRPEALELAVEPRVRDWVKSLLAKTTTDMATDHAFLVADNMALKARVEDLELRLRRLEQRGSEDDRYSLTKAKVIRLLKEHGID